MVIKNLCWIRRDLRLHDHHALSMALKSGDETYIAFIFDETMPKELFLNQFKGIIAKIENQIQEHSQ